VVGLLQNSNTTRVAVDMKFPIYIHRFCVDIHGYIHNSISIDACPVYMYSLTAHKAQLLFLLSSSIENIQKQNIIFAIDETNESALIKSTYMY